MKDPNFFIVGAPKCGTTALHHYLSDHPQVFLPWVKEPHYFCTDIPGFPRIQSLRQYRKLFDGASESHVAVGEASVFYLYSQAAVPSILQTYPDARFVVMVRDPVEMAHSLHSQYLYGCHESEQSFEAAWNLQAERAQGRQIPSCCPCPEVLQYARVCMLGQQVERLMGIVPRQRLLIVDFEEFKRDTRNVYVRVLDFLGVADDGRTDFPPVNVNRRRAWPMLSKLLMHPPFPLNVLKKSLKSWFGLYDTTAMAWLYNKLLRKAPREQMSATLGAEIASCFAEDQLKLKRLMEPAFSQRAA